MVKTCITTDIESSFGFLARQGCEYMRNQQELLDKNLHSVISKCFINNRYQGVSEIYVIYTDGNRERIWTFDPMQHMFDRREFIGKTKIEAVFYCDRKSSRKLHSLL